MFDHSARTFLSDTSAMWTQAYWNRRLKQQLYLFQKQPLKKAFHTDKFWEVWVKICEKSRMENWNKLSRPSHHVQTLNSYVSCETNFLFGRGQTKGSHTTHHHSVCAWVCVFARSEGCQRSQSSLDLWLLYRQSHPVQLFSQHGCLSVCVYVIVWLACESKDLL